MDIQCGTFCVLTTFSLKVSGHATTWNHTIRRVPSDGTPLSVTAARSCLFPSGPVNYFFVIFLYGRIPQKKRKKICGLKSENRDVVTDMGCPVEKLTWMNHSIITFEHVSTNSCWELDDAGEGLGKTVGALARFAELQEVLTEHCSGLLSQE